MKKACFTAVVLALSIFITSGFASTPKKDTTADPILTQLLKAVEKNDFSSFLANGNEGFKEGITKEMFDAINTKMAPRMKKGYKVVPLGTMNQQGCLVVLKKMVFNDGGDDVLTILSLRYGMVAGFFFQ
jgi:hypothetical protein